VHQVRPRHAHDPERRALRRPLRPHAGLRSGDRHRRLHEDQHPGRRLGRRAGPARPWCVSFPTVILRVSPSEERVQSIRLRFRLARHPHAHAIADARADGRGNPIGGVVYGNTFGAAQQYHEWTSFISDSEFCFRACVGPNAHINCQHIYDGTPTLRPSHSSPILTSPTVMGCYWNMPANYDSGYYESCKADDDLPMGVYGASTWCVPFVVYPVCLSRLSGLESDTSRRRALAVFSRSMCAHVLRLTFLLSTGTRARTRRRPRTPSPRLHSARRSRVSQSARRGVRIRAPLPPTRTSLSSPRRRARERGREKRADGRCEHRTLCWYRTLIYAQSLSCYSLGPVILSFNHTHSTTCDHAFFLRTSDESRPRRSATHQSSLRHGCRPTPAILQSFRTRRSNT
jgi:hypothetical protein